MMLVMRSAAALLLLAFAIQAPVAFAQTSDAPTGEQGQNATAENPGSDSATPEGGNAASSGSKPDDAGSSGWTGGTGGSFIGEDQLPDNENQPYKQPEVASGLNPFVQGSASVNPPAAR